MHLREALMQIPDPRAHAWALLVGTGGIAIDPLAGQKAYNGEVNEDFCAAWFALAGLALGIAER
jgi:hypothetical protein